MKYIIEEKSAIKETVKWEFKVEQHSGDIHAYANGVVVFFISNTDGTVRFLKTVKENRAGKLPSDMVFDNAGRLSHCSQGD